LTDFSRLPWYGWRGAGHTGERIRDKIAASKRKGM